MRNTSLALLAGIGAALALTLPAQAGCYRSCGSSAVYAQPQVYAQPVYHAPMQPQVVTVAPPPVIVQMQQPQVIVQQTAPEPVVPVYTVNQGPYYAGQENRTYPITTYQADRQVSHYPYVASPASYYEPQYRPAYRSHYRKRHMHHGRHLRYGHQYYRGRVVLRRYN